MGRALDPLQPRYNASVGGALADGATLTNATPVQVLVPLAGCVRYRFRFKATAGGTLAFAYCRANLSPAASPAQATPYTANNPSNITVAANVEAPSLDADHYGEDYLLITFTPSASGTVVYADISRV